MSALINETEQSKTLELLDLLKHKIEQSMMQDKSIVISMESPMIKFLKTSYICNYEFTTDRIYIDSDNVDFSIDISKVTNIIYEDGEEHFTLLHNDIEIRIYFI